MNNRTSLALSQWLQERGFEKETSIWCRYATDGHTDEVEYTTTPHENNEYASCIKSYDLLWDLCIKYAKEVFGEENDTIPTIDVIGRNTFVGMSNIRIASLRIIDLLQQNKKEDAEKYIMENSVLK